MNSLLYAFVISLVAGLIYWGVGSAISLDQTWSPIVVVILTVVARYVQEQLSPQPNRQGTIVVAALQVIATLIVVALLYQPAIGIGLTAALTVGTLLFVFYFVAWLVIEILVEVFFPTTTTSRATGK